MLDALDEFSTCLDVPPARPGVASPRTVHRAAQDAPRGARAAWSPRASQGRPRGLQEAQNHVKHTVCSICYAMPKEPRSGPRSRQAPPGAPGAAQGLSGAAKRPQGDAKRPQGGPQEPPKNAS